MSEEETVGEQHQFSVEGNYHVHYLEGRTPTERPMLLVASREQVSFQYAHNISTETEELRWQFAFVIRNFSETVRLDAEGPHAVLRSVYSYDEDDELATVAVNGGTLVPDGVLDAVRNRDEVVGFGRPPFIPERDGGDSGAE